MSASAKGQPITPEIHAKMMEARRLAPKKPTTEKMLRHLVKARAAKGPTRIELAVRALLDGFGVEFIEQHPIGVYTVDFFIPKIGLVIEADGAYWHKSAAREKARDAYLLKNAPVRDVLHLTEAQLKPWTPRTRHSTAYRTAIRAA